LLAGGADPNVPDSAWPPLFYAAMQGDLDVVKALAGAGADLERTHEGRTALAIAVGHHRWDVARFLLERSPSIAALGTTDPAGIARARGQDELADAIEAHRWSAESGGLRGRLRAFPLEGDARRHRVVLEFENVGLESRSVPEEAPLALTWRLTCDDEEVPCSRRRMELFHRADWARIAPGERRALRVSIDAAPTGPTARLDLVSHIWTSLPRGTLHLFATYRLLPAQDPNAPEDAVAFTLVLPGVRLPEPA
jgi:hypothetical protein